MNEEYGKKICDLGSGSAADAATADAADAAAADADAAAADADAAAADAAASCTFSWNPIQHETRHNVAAASRLPSMQLRLTL